MQTHELGLMVVFLAAGTLLRLVWAADMEWKLDEIWMYETAQQVARHQASWPQLGMPSSTGVLNPGLSIWCFIAIAYVAHTPVEMVRAVQILNIAALWVLFGFCRWAIPGPSQEQRLWLWGITLAGVSPLAIVFSRKIWAQDILPIVCVGLIISHWFRHRRWGAFSWGLLGVLIGQIHMSGFFLAAGLLIWTLYSDWQQPPHRPIRWLSWLIGTGLGLFPSLPWLAYLVQASTDGSRSWVGMVVPKFFGHWWSTSLGINLGYSLGSHFWSDLLPIPIIGGHPTYLVGVAHLILVGLGVAGVWHWFRTIGSPWSLLNKRQVPISGFYLRAIGLITGVLFTLSGLNIPVHYLIVTFPFIYLWLASIYSRFPLTWLLLLSCQLMISVSFLWLIHQTGGFADADYGLTYRVKMAAWP